MTDEDSALSRRTPTDAEASRSDGGVTVHEASVRLGVSPTAVDHWLKTGALTAHRDRLGRDVLSAAAVEAFGVRRATGGDAHDDIDRGR